MINFEIIKDEDLVQYNEWGFIPGPNENEQDYLSRIKKFNTKNGGDAAPLPSTVLELTSQLFFIVPQWLRVSYSNQELAPWQGGFVEIAYDKQNRVKALRLQLRKAFANSAEWLGIYQRDELLAHELAHVGRMAFDEPQFEEHLAYWTSRSRFRKWLGPLLESSHELWVFVAAALPAVIFPALLFLPLGILAAGFARLGYRHFLLNRALEKSRALLSGNERMARALIFRLTDKEIRHFARGSAVEIKKFIEVQKKSSLRWRAISLFLRVPTD